MQPSMKFHRYCPEKNIDTFFWYTYIRLSGETWRGGEPMETFRDYLKKAAGKAGSQNKLGIMLGVSGSAVSIIAMGGSGWTDDVILKLADFLGEDPAKLFLLRKLERCTEKTRPYWEEVFKRYASVALILLCTLPFSLGFSASNVDASIAPPGDHVSITRRTFGTPFFARLRGLLIGLLGFSDPSVVSCC